MKMLFKKKKPKQTFSFGRICEVDGKICRFHCWVEEDKVFMKTDVLVRHEEQMRLRYTIFEEDTIPLGCSAEVVRRAYALVEFPDGSVGKVLPERVHFIEMERAKR